MSEARAELKRIAMVLHEDGYEFFFDIDRQKEYPLLLSFLKSIEQEKNGES